MAHKSSYSFSAAASRMLIERGEYMNDWALGYVEFLARHRSKITGYDPVVIKEDIDEAVRIVKRNREAIENDR